MTKATSPPNPEKLYIISLPIAPDTPQKSRSRRTRPPSGCCGRHPIFLISPSIPHPDQSHALIVFAECRHRARQSPFPTVRPAGKRFKRLIQPVSPRVAIIPCRLHVPFSPNELALGSNCRNTASLVQTKTPSPSNLALGHTRSYTEQMAVIAILATLADELNLITQIGY